MVQFCWTIWLEKLILCKYFVWAANYKIQYVKSTFPFQVFTICRTKLWSRLKQVYVSPLGSTPLCMSSISASTRSLLLQFKLFTLFISTQTRQTSDQFYKCSNLSNNACSHTLHWCMRKLYLRLGLRIKPIVQSDRFNSTTNRPISFKFNRLYQSSVHL